MKNMFNKKIVIIWIAFALVVAVFCGVYIHGVIEEYSSPAENSTVAVAVVEFRCS